METPFTSVQLPYGLKDGELLSIHQVTSGLNCSCQCPGCGATLVARKGARRTPHFAHYRQPGTLACLETTLHQLAKVVLAEAKSLLLPALDVREDLPAVEEKGLSLPGLAEIDILAPRQVVIDRVVLEQQTGDIRPDVIVITPEGENIVVEMAVTHKVDDRKRQRLQTLGLVALEFDLSRLSRALSKEEVRQALVDHATPVEWLHHPQEAALREALQQKLLQQRHQQREAHRRECQARQQQQALLQARKRVQLRPRSVSGKPKGASWWAHNRAAEDFLAAHGRWPNKQESRELAIRVEQGRWQPLSSQYRWVSGRYYPKLPLTPLAIAGEAYRRAKYGEA